MTREEKNLLLKDLCARLPYGVKCSFGVDDAIYEVCGVNPTCCGASEIQATYVKSSINGDFSLSSCKPYLFPLSSITEEQKIELEQIKNKEDAPYYHDITDFFLKYHLDNRHLIEKGLAIDATGKNVYYLSTTHE